MEFWQSVLYIFIAVMILLLMVTIHEFGHYIAGRLLGFKINEFSIGFGPGFSVKNKRGEKISLRLFPLGGFCAFAGEDDDEEEENKKFLGENEIFYEQELLDSAEPIEKRDYLTFNEQKPWKRLIVLASGAIMNIITGYLFAVLFIAVAGNSLPIIGKTYDTENKAKFVQGDIIYKINGKELSINKGLAEYLEKIGEGEKIKVTVMRDGQMVEIQDVVKTTYTYTYINENGEEATATKQGIGIEIQGYKREGYNIIECFGHAFPLTWDVSGAILRVFGDIFKGRGLNQLTGPVGTIKAIADVSRQNAMNILILLPIIAINLGIFNLFPIPALDGSKIVFATIEWAAGKPLNRKVENIIHLVGFVLLFGLVILIDILSVLR